jgi:predicted nucleic acid-binding protein
MSIFLDSNVVLYAMGDDDAKRARGRAFLATEPTISTQVINECSHVLRRKAGWSPAQVAVELSAILDLTRLVDVRLEQIRSAWRLAERYGFGHYDSVILASALAAGCTTLYTEDLQHGQVIEGRLTLLNPFLGLGTP